MTKKKISLMCTAFRDGFQSVFGARVLSKDYLPVVKEAVNAGIRYIEAGGGASFQAAFFYNNENAFDVMDSFRAICGNDVNLQTLARGVNVVALDSQSSEMIKLHADLFKKHGMTTIRNFDALNDPQNLIYSGQCIVNAGLKHQLCVAMMSLPPSCTGAHTPDFYEERLKKFLKADIPFDSICFKDASGTAVPSVVRETVARARKLLGKKVPIEFHSHETAGTGLTCYLAAVEGGADIVDLSMAPVSGGTCQPDIATFWHALRGTDYELDCNIDAVMKVEEHLKEALSDYFIPPEALHADPRIPWSPMPGGALTANTQMLRDNNLMDKYAEIITAMEEVVRKGGFGTSVTPVSQFYFQQAFNNVMIGPWQKIAEGYGKMVLGYFGQTPVKPDSEVVKIAAEQLHLEPTTESVLSINDRNEKKSRRHYEKMLEEAHLPITDENVFIAASCGDKGIAFLEGKGSVKVRYKEKPKPVASSNGVYDISVAGEAYHVEIQKDKAIVNGVDYPIELLTETGTAQTPAPASAPASGGGSAHEIKAPTPGVITKILVSAGQTVDANTDVCVVVVMKMETRVKAGVSGKVTEITVQSGANVSAGQLLMKVSA